VTDTDAPTVIPVLADLVVSTVPYQKVVVPPLKVPGTFNAANARAAKAAVLALSPELPGENIDASLAAFRGTWRRFEYKGLTSDGAAVYDDYAHHPTAVRSTLNMVREQFPGKHVVVAFHPHLYSRTRDLMEEFATALALADEVVLAPIYAAREEPIEGVTSEVLAKKIAALGTPARALSSLDAIVKYFAAESCQLPPDTLCITMGAGDIYTVAERLTAGNRQV
jgi:UDP-N-acetylmuramate--alanine ligase